MSDKILDFAAAGAVADREFRFVTHPMKWTLAREAALEAQAQAAVERERTEAEHDADVAAELTAMWRNRAEAAEGTVRRQADALRLLGANPADPLRAEHQRLTDAVVEEAVEWQRRYAANLAAFGAQHPEVGR